MLLIYPEEEGVLHDQRVHDLGGALESTAGAAFGVCGFCQAGWGTSGQLARALWDQMVEACAFARDSPTSLLATVCCSGLSG